MPFAWLAGRTWYHGGLALIVAFVPENESGAFEDAARGAGYVVEGATYDAAFKKLRVTLRRASSARGA